MYLVVKSPRNKPLRLQDYTGLFCTWDSGFKVWGWCDGFCYLLMED